MPRPCRWRRGPGGAGTGPKAAVLPSARKLGPFPWGRGHPCWREAGAGTVLGHGTLSLGAGGSSWGPQHLRFSGVPQSQRVVGPGSRETCPASAWSLDDRCRPSPPVSAPARACGRSERSPGTARGPEGARLEPGQLSPSTLPERLALPEQAGEGPPRPQAELTGRPGGPALPQPRPMAAESRARGRPGPGPPPAPARPP